MIMIGLIEGYSDDNNVNIDEVKGEEISIT